MTYFLCHFPEKHERALEKHGRVPGEHGRVPEEYEEVLEEQVSRPSIINPRHACMRELSCLSVCMSVFSNLPSRTFRRPTKGISGYSSENAVKLKSIFF